MLARGDDPFYRSILTASHQPYDRFEVWEGNTQLATLDMAPNVSTDPDEYIAAIADRRPMVLAGSSLRATLMSPVSRTVTVNLPWYLYPFDDDSLFAPMGNELRIYSGVKLATGGLEYVWECFRGRIQDVDGDASSAFFTVLASDPAQDVVDNEFVTPQNSAPGVTVSTAARQLITDAYPRAEFGPSDDLAALVPALAWEFSRSSAIEEMMRSQGAIWYPQHDGKFVFRRYPWARAAPPVVTYRDGPQGTLTSARPSRSRSQLWNVVAATSERLNGDDPVFGLAVDDTPTSPTYVGGKFGVRTQLMRVQTPSTQGGIQATADARLRSAITPSMAFNWAMVRDCALELGDTVELELTEFDRRFVQVPTGFSYQFGAGAMDVTGRAQVVGEVQAG